MSAKHRIVMIKGRAFNFDLIERWYVAQQSSGGWGIAVSFPTGGFDYIAKDLESEEVALRMSEALFSEIEEECDTVISFEEYNNILSQVRAKIPTADIDCDIDVSRTITYKGLSFKYSDILGITVIDGDKILGKQKYNVVANLKDGDVIVFCEGLSDSSRAQYVVDVIEEWIKTNDNISESVIMDALH